MTRIAFAIAILLFTMGVYRSCAPAAPPGPPPYEDPPWRWSDRRLEREYLYHADPGAYIDDLAAQLVYTEAHDWDEAGFEDRGDDTSATLLFSLNDQTGTPVGLADAKGRLVAQFSGTPYGEPAYSELFTPGGSGDALGIESRIAAASTPFTHHGLRALRLDRPWDHPLDIGSADENDTGPYRVVIFNRNRLYDPAEGRFTGRDPNGLGMPVLASLPYMGMAPDIDHGEANVPRHFSNGANAHVAYGQMPRTRSDPSGLSWDPFDDMVDGYLAESAANAAAFMASLSDGFNSTAHILGQVAQLHPGIGLAVSAYKIAGSLGRGEMPALSDVLGALPMGRFGNQIGRGLNTLAMASMRFGSSAFAYARGHGSRVAGRLFAQGAFGWADNAGDVAAAAAGHCLRHCFSAGTMVWTLNGPVPITSITPGQFVLTAAESSPDADSVQGEDATDHIPQGGMHRLVHYRVHQENNVTIDLEVLLPEDWVDDSKLDRLAGTAARVQLPLTFRQGLSFNDSMAEVVKVDPAQWVLPPVGDAAPVMAIVTRTQATLMSIGMDAGGDTLLVTRDHPLWSVDQHRWTPAGDLKQGDRVFTRSGVSTVCDIRTQSSGQTVYNLSVAGGHTFFVGEDMVWAHNCWAGLHHLIPQYLQGLTNGARFNLSHAQHVQLHGLIDRASDVVGVPIRNQGGDQVLRWLRAGNDPDLIRAALVDAYAEFDRLNRTDLSSRLFREMSAQQGWLR